MNLRARLHGRGHGARHEVVESCLYAWRKRFADGAALVRPLLIPVSIEDEPGAAAAPSLLELAAIARALVVLPDRTRLEVDAGNPPSALEALLGALRRRTSGLM
jgi:hypothetical protein